MKPDVKTAIIETDQIASWFENAHKKADGINVVSLVPYSTKSSTDESGELRTKTCSYFLVYVEMFRQPQMVAAPSSIIGMPGGNGGMRR